MAAMHRFYQLPAKSVLLKGAFTTISSNESVVNDAMARGGDA